MPNDLVKSFAKKTEKSVDEVEKLWQQAKKSASEQGCAEDYAYITGILKKMLKIEGVKLKTFKEFVSEMDEAYKIGDKISYMKGKSKKSGKIKKIEDKNGDKRYELDNGAYVYHSDIE